MTSFMTQLKQRFKIAETKCRNWPIDEHAGTKHERFENAVGIQFLI
jgi:hypothetical protein